MIEFKVTEIINEEQIPRYSRVSSTNYEPLFDKFNRIGKGKAMVIPVEKKNHVNGIKNAFNKKFGKSAFAIAQRSKKNTDGTVTTSVYLTRKV